MAASGTFIKQHGRLLEPADDETEEKILKLPPGTRLHFTWTRIRNPRVHRFVMTMFEYLYDRQEFFTNRDSCRKYLTIGAGYYTEHKIPGRERTMLEADSIAFHKMDEDTFRELKGRVIDFVMHPDEPFFNLTEEESEFLISYYGG
jgi:hypothetical protein